MRKKFEKAVRERFSRQSSNENKIITEDDLKTLPEPVQKYLRFTGIVGKERIRNARICFEGDFMMKPDGKWLPVQTDQYSFLDNPSRIFLIKTKIAGFIPVSGIDRYIDGNGSMEIMTMNLFRVADARGYEMDVSELVTFFNDMVLMPSAFLGDNISWEAQGEDWVWAKIKDGDNEIAANLQFGANGEIKNFVSEDRFYSPAGKEYMKIKWSTPFDDYRQINGLMIPAGGRGIWHMESGDFCYARFRLKDIKYNLNSFA